MNDPYIVLGIPSGASMDQVNAAYRELSRRYSEQNMTEKLRELDEAYDAIAMRATGSYGSQTFVSVDYTDVRQKIKYNQLEDALTILNGIPDSSKNAEWYYLMGQVCQKKGWLEDAAKNFSAASAMEPDNTLYASACEGINRARNGGYRVNREKNNSSGSGCSFCKICTGLICADSCCECFGGDIIPCC